MPRHQLRPVTSGYSSWAANLLPPLLSLSPSFPYGNWNVTSWLGFFSSQSTTKFCSVVVVWDNIQFRRGGRGGTCGERAMSLLRVFFCWFVEGNIISCIAVLWCYLTEQLVNVVSCENHVRFGQYLSENLLFVQALHPRRLLFISYILCWPELW
jgi:hypothetical protein